MIPLSQRRYRGTTGSSSSPAIVTAVLPDPDIRLAGQYGPDGGGWTTVLLLPLPDAGAWSFTILAGWAADSPEARPEFQVIAINPDYVVSGGGHAQYPVNLATSAQGSDYGGVVWYAGTVEGNYPTSQLLLQARGGIDDTNAATVTAGATQGYAIETGVPQ